jgi:3-methylcrotonyl-CoA carboxylase alpha subunit
MLAKVIAWAQTRDAAIGRLARALNEIDVRGIVTNVPFLSALITHPDVRANAIDTGFIERRATELTGISAAPGETELAAAVAGVVQAEREASRIDAASPWRAAGWMPVGRRQREFLFRHGQREHEVALVYGNGPSQLRVGNRSLAFEFEPDRAGGLTLVLDGMRSRVVSLTEGHEVYVRTRNGRFEFYRADPFCVDDEEQAAEDRIMAPLPGIVVALLAQEGSVLEKGAPILTLEVMKMEQTLRAPCAGTLKTIRCKVGDIVQEGIELAEIEPAA